MATDGKTHLSIVICGHVDSGKSTTTGRLLFELGGIPEREMEKLKAEAERLGKSSFAFAFYMDRCAGGEGGAGGCGLWAPPRAGRGDGGAGTRVLPRIRGSGGARGPAAGRPARASPRPSPCWP